MGTRFELVLAGGVERELRAAGEEALEEISRIERLVSPHRSDRQVAHLRRRAPRWTPLDAEVIQLLSLCRDLKTATGGRFDPTLGSGDLDIREHEASLSGPDVPVDLGAVGKGWALDRALDLLRDAGVTCALLHGGTSTVAALGHPPDRESWSVQLAHDPPVSVALPDGLALSVSAPRGEERMDRHVVDPRTGAAATGRELAAVVASSAAFADAWSTALLVGGSPPTDTAALIIADGAPQVSGPSGVFL